MAKDLVDEETDFASDYDMETSSSATSSVTSSLYNIHQIHSEQQEQTRPDSSLDALPSIEELTRNMQDLTERDLLLSSGLDVISDKSHNRETKLQDIGNLNN